MPWEEEGKHCTRRNQCTKQIIILSKENQSAQGNIEKKEMKINIK